MRKIGILCGAAAGVCGLSGMSQAAVTPYTADASTVALYHLDETAGTKTAADASGHGLNLTASVSPFGGTAGPGGLGTAPTFPDTNGGYQLNKTLDATQAALFSTTAFTIEAWVRDPDLLSTQPASNNDHNGIFAYRSSTGRFQFTVVGPDGGAAGSAGELRLDYNKDVGGSPTFYSGAATSPLTWDAGVWYHVVVTYDANTVAANDSVIKFYRSAEGETTPTLIATLTNQPDLVALGGGGALLIGGFDGIQGRNFGGGIDEVRFTNGVLTQFNLETVPTPSALGGGLWLLGALAWRRRR